MEQTIHHLLVTWMQFILDWGYVGVFVMMALESTAFPIPAEVILPPAAYWASQGRMNIWLVVVVATAGSWAGSAASYWIAHALGRPLFDRYGKFVLMSPHKIEAADQWFDAYGTGGIFVARMLPGIRHVISIPAGIFRMNFRKFSLMTILGAGIFNGALIWFGLKVLGNRPDLMKNPDALIAALKDRSHWLIGAALAIGLLYGVMVWMQRRAKAKAA
jgi:membrane protein DedA with SNARE-associated domain